MDILDLTAEFLTLELVSVSSSPPKTSQNSEGIGKVVIRAGLLKDVQWKNLHLKIC